MISRSDFLLREDVVFLNHGSFGACPTVLLNEQRVWIERMEQQPVLFFRDIVGLMKSARTELATFVGAQPEDLVFVTNSTFGVNVIAHAFSHILEEGDEILTTNHEYGACDRAWNQYCLSKGVQYVRTEIPLPAPSAEEMVEIIWSKVTKKTKVLFLSHITSAAAIRLPVEVLCARAKAAGIRSVIDGSHAPGHIPLDLSTLRADAYTANCHKWMCTPKGSAFLWVSKELQPIVPPLVVSWGDEIPTAGDGPFNNEHEFLGTRDMSPFLTIPFALRWMKQQPWSEVQKYSRELAACAMDMLCAIPNVSPVLYSGQDPLLQMTAVILPGTTDVVHMKQWLYNEKAIEVVVHRWLGVPMLRCSAHAHTRKANIEFLALSVREYLKEYNQDS